MRTLDPRSNEREGREAGERAREAAEAEPVSIEEARAIREAARRSDGQRAGR